MTCIPDSDFRTALRLGEITTALSDTLVLSDVCSALVSGRLLRDSGAATRASLAHGNAATERCIAALQDVWTALPSSVSGASLCLTLLTANAASTYSRDTAPTIEIAWTGPRSVTSSFRATREVLRALIGNAQRDLLIVGYWIAAREDQDGIIEEFITTLADCVRRGIFVRFVVDERRRADGLDNRQILTAAWPSSVPLPNVLTWHLPVRDEHSKLHSKVVVADRRDAFVTSANLTSYAMNRNMEMGVRVTGVPAEAIAQHFQGLIDEGVLQPYITSKD